MWIVISCALTALASIAALATALFAVQRANRGSGLSPAKLRSFESRIASLETSQDELRELLTDLANRVKMTKVRNVVQHGLNGAGPDPYKDPDNWRKWMTKRIAESKLGVKL